MLLTCRSTVRSLMKSSAAIVRLLFPAATSRSTSSSRALSGCAASKLATPRVRALRRARDRGQRRAARRSSARHRAPSRPRRDRRAPGRRGRSRRARAPASYGASSLLPDGPGLAQDAERRSDGSPSASRTAPRACAAVACSTVASRSSASAVSSSAAVRAAGTSPAASMISACAASNLVRAGPPRASSRARRIAVAAAPSDPARAGAAPARAAACVRVGSRCGTPPRLPPGRRAADGARRIDRTPRPTAG